MRVKDVARLENKESGGGGGGKKTHHLEIEREGVK